MTFNISEHNTIQVLEVKNLLNELDNKKILSEVESRMNDGYNKFILDLSQLDFMNSIGLNFMISMRSKSQKNGGDLAIANAPGQVENLLKVTKLSDFFTLVPSVEDAISQINQDA